MKIAGLIIVNSLSGLASSLLLLPLAALAGDESADYAAGKARAFTCAECHGERGNSFLDKYPDLCGEDYRYLVKSLNAYKSGRKQDEDMTDMVMNLSAKDIHNLATYYSRQRCE